MTDVTTGQIRIIPKTNSANNYHGIYAIITGKIRNDLKFVGLKWLTYNEFCNYWSDTNGI